MFLDGKKKLLIVDDSAFMRKIIGDFFFNHPTIDVIGTARNGKDALMKIKSLKPDVVTMDIEMPEMNGIEALKLIMAEHPVPIVMLSSTTDSGTENTMLAMEYGAVDFVAKPSGTISLDLHKIKDELVEKILEASQVPLKKIRNSEVRNLPNNPVFIENSRSSQKVIHSNKGNDHAWSASRKKIVLIGTSTGGPRALQEVLTRLPKDIKSPILIVQHMPAGFTKSLASRLDQLSDIHVKEAEHGEELVDGTAYIAPGGYHLIVSRIGKTYSVELNDKLPPRVGHRPSVDVLFESVSQIKEVDKIAVIMTGMGSDGSKGLIQLKENGVVKTISESADTCIVYGMPKAAYETGLIDEVADVEDIAKIIMKFLP